MEDLDKGEGNAVAKGSELGNGLDQLDRELLAHNIEVLQKIFIEVSGANGGLCRELLRKE